MRGITSLAFLTLVLAPLPAMAKDPPKAVRIYSQCVIENFREPGEEVSENFDQALDLAKAMCGNLRPAAVEVVSTKLTKRMTSGGDTPESAAQAFLDIFVLEQAAAIWAEKHPEDDSHGR